MGGDSRPGIIRVSMFSGDQEESEIPIVGQQGSWVGHLAVKAEEWNEPGVREGIYTASIMYIRTHGDESSGSKLNSIESVKMERGEVIGDES